MKIKNVLATKSIALTLAMSLSIPAPFAYANANSQPNSYEETLAEKNTALARDLDIEAKNHELYYVNKVLAATGDDNATEDLILFSSGASMLAAAIPLADKLDQVTIKSLSEYEEKAKQLVQQIYKITDARVRLVTFGSGAAAEDILRIEKVTQNPQVVAGLKKLGEDLKKTELQKVMKYIVVANVQQSAELMPKVLMSFQGTELEKSFSRALQNYKLKKATVMVSTIAGFIMVLTGITKAASTSHIKETTDYKWLKYLKENNRQQDFAAYRAKLQERSLQLTLEILNHQLNKNSLDDQ